MKQQLKKLTAVVSAAAVVTVGGIVGLSSPAKGNGIQTTLDIGRGSITITADSVSGYDSSGNAVAATDPDGYIITGSTTSNTVTVSGTQKITLDNATINVSGNDYYRAFDIVDGGNVTLTLEGVNTIKSGAECAGIEVRDDEKLEITGEGSLTVTGGQYGAGIGTGYNDTNGIQIGTVVITGGSVIAKGGDHAASVGGGAKYYCMEGDVVIYLPVVYCPPKDKDGNDLYPCTIENPNSETITIDGVEFLPKIHSESEKKVYAYLMEEVHCIKVGDTQYYTTAHKVDYSIDYLELNEVTEGTAFTVTATNSGETAIYGRDYTYPADTGVLTILSDKVITVSGTTTSDHITIAENITANVTLNSVNINVSGYSDISAFNIPKTSGCNITLVGANFLKSGSHCAGLQK